MDLLQKLYDGEMSIDDAYELLEPGGESLSYEKYGFSYVEVTAFLLGTSIDAIAKWRYEGWPEKCAICKFKLPRLDEGGWSTAFSTEHGDIRIVHIECIPEEPE